MGQESLNELSRQNLLRSQENGEGELFPAEIPPASMSLSPDNLTDLLLGWIRTPDWATSQSYLQTHSNLLTEAAVQALEILKHAQKEEQTKAMIDAHQKLLQEARAEGIEAAYKFFLASAPETPFRDQEQEQLLRQIEEWINTPDWEQSQVYLEAHPGLLTGTAEALLTALQHSQQTVQAQAILQQHQQLLQKAREESIAASYQALHELATLHEAGTAALRQYQANGQEADLNRAVECWHSILNLTPLDSPDRAGLLNNLGNGLCERYGRTGNLADLETAISSFQQAIQTTSPSSPDRPRLLNNLGNGLYARYAYTRNVADLETAISSFQQAVLATSLTSPDRADRVSNLGNGLYARYAHTGKLTDLETAISSFQQAVQATSPGSPNLLNNLGNGLYARYARTGKLADLETAISSFQQAVLATSLNSPDRPARLNNLGSGLRTRYDYTGNLADLEAAISSFQQAVLATSPGSPDWPARLSNLGNSLCARYARTGHVTDLETAISSFQQAVQATSLDSLDRPALLSSLGNGLCYRYACTENLTDLETAISAFQQAVQATSLDSSDRAPLLNNLGNGLYSRYDRTGNLTDLKTAISSFQQAVQATSLDSPDRPALLSNLGNGLRTRYDHTGNLADLEVAISLFQQAVQTTSLDSPDRAARLNRLGSGLRTQYDRMGNLTDLETAISAFQQAVQATSLGSPDWPTWLSNLGSGVYERYTRTANLADLETAISSFQQAVQATSLTSPDRPARLSNLGSGLCARYDRMGNLADLETAISSFQQAVQATSPDSPDWPSRLSNLGNGLCERYARTGNLADLETAISSFQQAVQAISLDSPGLSTLLNNLGGGLRTRYERTGNLTDLEAAISSFQQAVQITSLHSPDWLILLNNLGNVLRIRYDRTGNLADLEAAIDAWERSWSIPHLRFAALPVTYQLGQQRQEAELSASLVTAHLERTKLRFPRSQCVPGRVLEIVEGSKSRLLTQLISRGPLPLPVELSPEIAAREEQLLAKLIALDTQELAFHDHLVPTKNEGNHLLHLQQRQEALHELEDLWARIALIGPEGTAYAAQRRGSVLTWQDVRVLARTLGPASALLSFFLTADRTLLFLLRAGWRAPRMVEVPLKQTGWIDLMERHFREIHLYQPDSHRGETWDQSLSLLFTRAQQYLGGVERLILAPSGNGHLLPWAVLAERAGWHTPDGKPPSLVTLPTLSILPTLKQRSHVPPGPVLVVGNPCSDRPLPYAEAEANEVAERFGTDPLLGAAATKARVLAHLPDATLIHLATHAFFDPKDPLKSGIVLADGVLTAREILPYRLQADLLVLSACDSGQVGSLGGEELAGLSQAFLQTGVRSLLVSLWPVNDPATATLMQAFYAAWQAGADKALALRQAMTRIQQDPRWTHPYYWGAFVLLGDWN